jgi:outer membrane protein TolC
MAPSVQAMQMVPLFGKLGLSRRIAELDTDIARADADEAWWTVRARAAAAFYQVYETDRQLEVMRETLGLLRDFEQIARAVYATGAGGQSDVLRAGVEVSRMVADITRMESMRIAAVARLNAHLDRPALTEVESVLLPSLPRDVPDPDTLESWARLDRPVLERGRTAVDQARNRTDLVRRDIWPDPVIGVQYGQRGDASGTQRMGSVMLGFTVPVFAGTRQMRRRDEAAAMEAAARAELASLQADVGARILELVAELDRTRTLVRLYRAEILPQARATVESSLSSYRVGRVDFMTLVDAQMSVNVYEQELIALIAGYGSLVAELEATVGRGLPVIGPALAEVS